MTPSPKNLSKALKLSELPSKLFPVHTVLVHSHLLPQNHAHILPCFIGINVYALFFANINSEETICMSETSYVLHA